MYFENASHLERLIDTYFEHLEGEFHFEDVPDKNKTDDMVEKKKVWDRPSEPPTLTGLAFHLGFDSCEALDDYCISGEYAALVKRAKLRVETAYEQKLHNGPASGAIFALKKLGWNRAEIAGTANNGSCEVNVTVEESRVPVAYSEKEVLI